MMLFSDQCNDFYVCICVLYPAWFIEFLCALPVPFIPLCFLPVLQDIRNTVGNVPMEWYEGYKHLGYDVKGQKIVKPEGRDKLEEFLNKMDNPDYWYASSTKIPHIY